jgi:hypothetical protein
LFVIVFELLDEKHLFGSCFVFNNYIGEQVKRISRAAAKGLITDHYKQYGLAQVPRVLFTVETENMLRLVLKRLDADPLFTPGWMKQVFLFGVAQSVWKDFASGWLNLERHAL